MRVLIQKLDQLAKESRHLLSPDLVHFNVGFVDVGATVMAVAISRVSISVVLHQVTGTLASSILPSHIWQQQTFATVPCAFGTACLARWFQTCGRPPRRRAVQ